MMYGQKGPVVGVAFGLLAWMCYEENLLGAAFTCAVISIVSFWMFFKYIDY